MTKQKKILYIWKGIYPWDVRVEKICKALTDNGSEVFILARAEKGQSEYEKIDSFNIIRVGYNKKFALTLPISINPIWKNAIDKTVQQLKPDIIITREIMLGTVAGKIAKKYNIPCIMDMAENYPAAMREWKKYNDSFISRFIVHNLKIPDKTEKNSIKYYDGIITVCEEQNERLNSIYNFPLNNIEVVHNTFDLNIYNTARKSLNFPPKIFGHHGFLSADKSLKTFIEGFILAAKELNDIKFYIAGGGECYEEYKNIIVYAGMNEQIILMGDYNFKDLPKILDSIDIGVMPYPVSDFNNYTIHNKIFDFMSSGKPVIVSQAIPLKRIVDECQCGIVTDCSQPENIANSIKQIVNETPSKLKDFSKQGLKLSKDKYNWGVDSEKLINFINKFI